MKTKGLFALILSVFVVGTVTAQSDVAPPAGPMIGMESTGARYLLGPGDEITGRVLGEEQFNFTTFVNEDGNILVPFFEKPIVAMCRTEKAVRADLIMLLEKQLRNPQFSMNIKRNSRPPATVFGEVKTPTRFDLRRTATLFELLAEAGGPTEEAGGIINIKRPQPSACPEEYDRTGWEEAVKDEAGIPTKTFSLSRVMSGRDDIAIYPGDIIEVRKAPPVWVVGEVSNPNGIYIREEGLTLTEAIVKIGGLKREAKTKEIKIYRLKNSANLSDDNLADAKQRDVITANLDAIKKQQEQDPLLMPYDIIEIEKSKDSIAMTIAKVALGATKTIVSSGASNLGYRVIY
jgi:polysaccharide export outer membrane protein